VQVVMVSGDRDADGYNKTTQGFPWVSFPFGKDKSGCEAKIKCTGQRAHIARG